MDEIESGLRSCISKNKSNTTNERDRHYKFSPTFFAFAFFSNIFSIYRHYIPIPPFPPTSLPRFSISLLRATIMQRWASTHEGTVENWRSNLYTDLPGRFCKVYPTSFSQFGSKESVWIQKQVSMIVHTNCKKTNLYK